MDLLSKGTSVFELAGQDGLTCRRRRIVKFILQKCWKMTDDIIKKDMNISLKCWLNCWLKCREYVGRMLGIYWENVGKLMFIFQKRRTLWRTLRWNSIELILRKTWVERHLFSSTYGAIWNPVSNVVSNVTRVLFRNMSSLESHIIYTHKNFKRGSLRMLFLLPAPHEKAPEILSFWSSTSVVSEPSDRCFARRCVAWADTDPYPSQFECRLLFPTGGLP